MKYYQHSFDSVEGYLHHRSPYLLVEEIDRITDQGVSARARVDTLQTYVRGHFPGAPILPGALMQEMTTQTAGILIAAEYNPMPEYDTTDPFFNEFAVGVLIRVKQARYLGFARPGDELHIRADLESHLDSFFEFRGSIQVNGETIMRNCFQLANIPSKTLQGVAC